MPSIEHTDDQPLDGHPHSQYFSLILDISGYIGFLELERHGLMAISHRFWFRMLLSACLVLTAFPSLAQINPFGRSRSDPRLSATDLSLLRDSVDRLNQDPKSEVGSEDKWFNPATGSGGKSVIIRSLTNAGRPCHEMHHEFSPLGQTPSRSYDLTWCRVSDGTWKIARYCFSTTNPPR